MGLDGMIPVKKEKDDLSDFAVQLRVVIKPNDAGNGWYVLELQAFQELQKKAYNPKTDSWDLSKLLKDKTVRPHFMEIAYDKKQPPLKMGTNIMANNPQGKVVKYVDVTTPTKIAELNQAITGNNPVLLKR